METGLQVTQILADNLPRSRASTAPPHAHADNRPILKVDDTLSDHSCDQSTSADSDPTAPSARIPTERDIPFGTDMPAFPVPGWGLYPPGEPLVHGLMLGGVGGRGLAGLREEWLDPVARAVAEVPQVEAVFTTVENPHYPKPFYAVRFATYAEPGTTRVDATPVFQHLQAQKNLKPARWEIVTSGMRPSTDLVPDKISRKLGWPFECNPYVHLVKTYKMPKHVRFRYNGS